MFCAACSASASLLQGSGRGSHPPGVLQRILAIPLVTTFYLGPAGLFVYLLAVRPFYPLLTGVKED